MDSSLDSSNPFNDAEKYLDISLPLGIKKICIMNRFDNP